MNIWLDSDGYPTDGALDKISKWDYSDIPGLFKFIYDIWWMPEFGWRETTHDDGTQQYSLSTGGWSGNESILRALKDNSMIWLITWYSSRRGGHHVFLVKELE